MDLFIHSMMLNEPRPSGFFDDCLTSRFADPNMTHNSNSDSSSLSGDDVFDTQLRTAPQPQGVLYPPPPALSPSASPPPSLPPPSQQRLLMQNDALPLLGKSKPKGKRKPRPEDLSTDVIRELIKEQQTKKMRLARKAELARVSRVKKKEHLETLEAQVEVLQSEIRHMHQQHQVDQKKILLLQGQLYKHQQAAETAAATAAARQSMLGEGASLPASLAFEKIVADEKQANQTLAYITKAKPGDALQDADVSQYVENLVTLFNQRNDNAAEQVQALRAGLSSCMPMRFLQWAVSQNEQFYSDPSSLWNSLLRNEIGLSKEQMDKLLSLRDELKAQRTQLERTEASFGEFSETLGKYRSSCLNNLSQLTALLTPKQMAKFLVWVDQNQLCVKMLESVLSGTK